MSPESFLRFVRDGAPSVLKEKMWDEVNRQERCWQRLGSRRHTGHTLIS